MILQGQILVLGLTHSVLTPHLRLSSPFLWETKKSYTLSILHTYSGLGLSGEVSFEVLGLPVVVMFFSRPNTELFA